jgi:hypothetical protein
MPLANEFVNLSGDPSILAQAAAQKINTVFTCAFPLIPVGWTYVIGEIEQRALGRAETQIKERHREHGMVKPRVEQNAEEHEPPPVAVDSISIFIGLL